MLYEKLDYILAIAEEQNLTRAAKKLYISQPTLTMYLNRLEDDLGVRLFDRKKNPILLTTAGRHYIEKMREIAEAEQILRGELHTVASPKRIFRIGSSRVRGNYWLPPLLRILADRYPELSFSVTLGTDTQMRERLEKGYLDFVIAVLSDMPENSLPIETRDVAVENVMLVAHRSFGLVPSAERAGNSPDRPWVLSPERLHGIPFIAPSSENGMYVSFQKMIAQYKIQPGNVLAIDSMTTGLMMTAQGLGAQLISAGILIAITDEAQRRELDYCVLPGFPATRKSSVAWREDTDMLPLIQEASQILLDEVLPKMIYTKALG